MSWSRPATPRLLARCLLGTTTGQLVQPSGSSTRTNNVRNTQQCMTVDGSSALRGRWCWSRAAAESRNAKRKKTENGERGAPLHGLYSRSGRQLPFAKNKFGQNKNKAAKGRNK
jgi:hypothetical protein